MSAARSGPSGYAGFVTRALALTLDALAVNVIALLFGGAVRLISSLFGDSGGLNAVEAVIGGVAWILWSGTYFIAFWSLTGQTPGSRVLGIRVMTATGSTIGPFRALRRYVWLVLSMLPLGAGFLPVLVDDRRRGLHDRRAKTVVRWDDGLPVEVPAVQTDPVPSPPVGAPAGNLSAP